MNAATRDPEEPKKYYFAVVVMNEAGTSGVSNSPSATQRCSGAEVECEATLLRRPRPTASVPARLALPSPISLRTGLPARFTLEAGPDDLGQPYVVELFDVAGRRVAWVGSGLVGDGPAALELLPANGGTALRPGVHFLRARIGDRRVVRTLVMTP